MIDDESEIRWLSADELEAQGKAPWQGEQPIAEHAKTFRGRQWVPLEAAESALQFWQRRDYEHTLALMRYQQAAPAFLPISDHGKRCFVLVPATPTPSVGDR